MWLVFGVAGRDLDGAQDHNHDTGIPSSVIICRNLLLNSTYSWNEEMLWCDLIQPVLKNGTYPNQFFFQNVVWLKSTLEKLLRVHLESLIVRKCMKLCHDITRWPDYCHIKSTLGLSSVRPHSSYDICGSDCYHPLDFNLLYGTIPSHFTALIESIADIIYYNVVTGRAHLSDGLSPVWIQYQLHYWGYGVENMWVN